MNSVQNKNRNKNQSKIQICGASLLSGLLLLVPFLSKATDGLTDTEISFGSSLVLSGGAQDLGLGFKKGYETYINKVNAAGGVSGRKIKMIIKDDKYEPSVAKENTQSLIGGDKVFGLFGFVGTPTTNAAVSVLNEQKVPLLGMFTGAEIFRTPVNPLLFHVRASYFQETEHLVKHFTEDLGIKKIGVLMQQDAYGAAGRDGVVGALERRGLKLLVGGAYERDTVNIDEAYTRIKEAQPEALILIGAYKACAAFMKKAKSDGLKVKIANISFVGSKSLMTESGNAGEGTYISQVMPSPWKSQLAIVKDYRKDMEASGAKDFDYTSLEGYVSARVLVEALKVAGKDISRDSFGKAIRGMNADIGGMAIAFKETQYAQDKVYLTKIVKGEVVEVEKMD